MKSKHDMVTRTTTPFKYTFSSHINLLHEPQTKQMLLRCVQTQVGRKMEGRQRLVFLFNVTEKLGSLRYLETEQKATTGLYRQPDRFSIVLLI